MNDDDVGTPALGSIVLNVREMDELSCSSLWIDSASYP